MKSLLLAASAILQLLTGDPAQAADIPMKNPMYKPPVAYSWTGTYFGGHLGAGWATDEWRATESGLSSRLGSGAAPGFLGGVQIGVNHQVDAVVFGLEADVSWANLSGETCYAVRALASCNSQADRIGTVAGRLGIAIDRALVYSKAGAAWVHGAHGLTVASNPNVEGTVSKSKWGWTAGAGVEYALTRNWSAKLEYDFMDFGTSRFDFDFTATPGIGIVSTDVKQRIHAVKFGWNYKFDWRGAVAAGY
jgi:outer membrane immunogenic protein